LSDSRSRSIQAIAQASQATFVAFSGQSSCAVQPIGNQRMFHVPTRSALASDLGMRRPARTISSHPEGDSQTSFSSSVTSGGSGVASTRPT
jgi:hypothetical protein